MAPRALTRPQATAISKLVKAHAGVAECEKMLARARAAEDRAVVSAHRVGVSQAEIARSVEQTPARVWQRLAALGALVRDDGKAAAEGA